MPRRSFLNLLPLALLGLATLPAGQARLAHRAGSGHALHHATLTADGRHVVFVDQHLTIDAVLLSAPVDHPGAPVVLGPHWTGSQDFEVSRTGADVFFRTPARLLRRPADGSQAGLDLAPELGTVHSFVLAPAGEHLAFVAHDGTRYGLFGVAADGGSAPVPLDGGLPLELISPPRYQISADGARVVFAVVPAPGTFALYSAPLDGSAPPTLLAAPAAGDLLYRHRVRLAGARAVYPVLHASPAGFELFSVPLDGSAAPVSLSAALAGYDLSDSKHEPSPDGAWVVFLARHPLGAYSPQEAFLVPSDGSAAPRLLNAPLVQYGDVEDARFGRFTPDGQRYVYLADQEQDERFELYSALLDGSAPPVKLNAPLPAGADVDDAFQLTADEPCRVVYLADAAADGVTELWSVPADGSAPPRRLNSPLPVVGLRDVFHFTLDQARTSALYAANEDSAFGQELHVVPSNGSRRAERLSSRPTLDDPFLQVFDYEQRGDAAVFQRTQRAGTALYDLYIHRAPRIAAR